MGRPQLSIFRLISTAISVVLLASLVVLTIRFRIWRAPPRNAREALVLVSMLLLALGGAVNLLGNTVLRDAPLPFDILSLVAILLALVLLRVRAMQD